VHDNISRGNMQGTLLCTASEVQYIQWRIVTTTPEVLAIPERIASQMLQAIVARYPGIKSGASVINQQRILGRDGISGRRQT
jgi:hypothetical protein